MKKVLAVLVLLVSVSTAAAQIHETTYVDIGNARSVNSASIGLNLSHSSHTNIQFADDGWSASHAILFNAYRNSTNLTGSLATVGETKYSHNVGNYNNGAGAIMYFGNGGTMDFLISPASTGEDSDIDWGTPKMRIKRNGNVGINTGSPTEKLTVNGNIRAEEIVVTEDIGADFVFEGDYPLPTISEIEQHIITHKHLKGIPSAEEMIKNGVKVGKLQMKLLQKIEELTLYIIELEKRDKRREAEINRIIATINENKN